MLDGSRRRTPLWRLAKSSKFASMGFCAGFGDRSRGISTYSKAEDFVAVGEKLCDDLLAD